MIKSFKEYYAEQNRTDGHEVNVFYHFASDDVLARIILVSVLNEDRKHLDLGKGREIFFHTAHVQPGQDHLHFKLNGAKLYAINRDGSAHDASHGKQMARWAQEGMRDSYLGFTVPKDGLIEALVEVPSGKLLLENDGSAMGAVVSRALQLTAEAAILGWRPPTL